MIYYLITLMLILDAVLIYFIYNSYKKTVHYEQILSDITEERQIITRMQKQINSDFLATETKSKELLSKIEKIAAEIEQEIKQSAHIISSNLDEAVKDLSLQFESPLKELTSKKQAVMSLSKKIDEERTALAALLERAESFAKFFDKGLPYQEVMKDIEQKKYTDARHLLTKGLSVEAVAKKLGMQTSEVRLIAGLT